MAASKKDVAKQQVKEDREKVREIRDWRLRRIR